MKTLLKKIWRKVKDVIDFAFVIAIVCVIWVWCKIVGEDFWPDEEEF